MFSGDFLKTIEELHYNRGITIARIASELGVSRRLMYYLRNLQKLVTPKILKRADEAFPKLLRENLPLRGSEKFRQEIYLFQGKEALEKSVMEAIEANRIPREKLRRKVTPMWKESTEFAGRKFFPLVPSPKISRSFELGEFRLPDCYLNSILQL